MLCTGDVESAIRAGESFLLEAQSDEGLWRDFALEPGSSDAWTTACIGWALMRPPAISPDAAALSRASDALRRLFRQHGWGYNASTAIDADSTAWCLRYLAALGDLRGVDAAACLLPFITSCGAARTFLSPQRFGRWSDEHQDVTPTVGLALCESGAVTTRVAAVRSACLASFEPEVPWRAFWWATDAYAIARNLEFLAVSGGVPENMWHACLAWLAARAHPTSPFECAQRLLIADYLGEAERACSLECVLLDAQNRDGSWPESPMLLVPGQARDATGRVSRAHPDPNRLMTTAAAVLALKQRLRSASVSRSW